MLCLFLKQWCVRGVIGKQQQAAVLDNFDLSVMTSEKKRHLVLITAARERLPLQGLNDAPQHVKMQ